MGDVKLFRITEAGAKELPAALASSERELHDLIEGHLQSVLGVRFLAREFATGRFNRGYIDSLGLDENNCPVIVEYKRRANDNVINQALYYLDWLLDHKGDFQLLVKKTLGDEAAGKIEFSSIRIICVASSFSRFDERAILQMGRNIELIRYKIFADNLLMVELLNNSRSLFSQAAPKTCETGKDDETYRLPMPPELLNRLCHMSADTEKLYLDLMELAEDLGEDVSIKFLKHYIALSRLKNFASIQPLKNNLKMWLSLDPSTVVLEEGFSRDVSGIGHLGPGNVQVELRDRKDLDKAAPLIRLAYERN